MSSREHARGGEVTSVDEGDEKKPDRTTSFTPTPYPRPRAEPETGRSGRARSAARVASRVVVALASVLALLATGYAYTTLDEIDDNVQTTDALQQNDDVEAKAPPQDDGATDILLVGADARTDMQGNPLPLDVLKTLRTESKNGVSTDTLIILRIPKDGGKPTGVSIPRDTWVDVPQGGRDKINSAFGVAKAAAAARLRAEGMTDGAEVERESDQAGRRALVRTVQDFTEIRIDHYAEVNLLGFYLLTEALGGVTVCLNNATADKDSGANFRAGTQVVSGGEALSFVRQRKNLPRGDLDRIVRQQAFLASALHQVLSTGTLTNSDKLNSLTDAVRRSLVLDPDLDLLKFADQVKGIASGDIEFVTIPVEAVGARSADGQSIVEVDVPKVRSFVRGTVGAGGTADQPAAGAGGGSAPGSAPRQITADGVACVN
ncbi:LCP family protein [Qaidamihabitans albus]|uniref:LCP family protein n=1 Tax=Qaidamihabitans albus TaxID=2795733 RepID=UPI0018F23F9F